MTRLKILARNKGMIAAFVLLAAYVLYWWLYNPRMLSALFLAVAVPLMVFVVLISFGKIRITSARLFLILLVVFGLLFCFVFPPMKVPDEPYHYLSTQWLVNAITGNGTLSSPDVLLRGDDWLLYSKFNSSVLTSGDYATVANDFAWFCSDGPLHLIDNRSFTLGSVNPSAKLFTVLGLLIAKCLNLGAYPTFYLGRLFSLGFFVVSAYGAYKIAPKGKGVVAFVSLLPMTLHLAASYSYDCGIISYSLLIYAFLMRGFFGEEGGIGIREVAVYCVVAALLAPCKVIYSCICILGLLVPSSKFSDKKLALLSKGILCLAIAAAVVVIRLSSITELAVGSDLSIRGEETGHFYTLSGIVCHPLRSFQMLVRTLDGRGDFYWESMLGFSLGWFQGEIGMPAFFMLPYLGMSILCCFESEDDDAQLPWHSAACFVVVFVLVALGVMLSMWIGWTFDTEATIDGVQGRYFLPALPILLFALRSHRLTFKGDTTRVVLCGMGVMNLVYLVRLFSIAASL